jgi:hypothetical protein
MKGVKQLHRQASIGKLSGEICSPLQTSVRSVPTCLRLQTGSRPYPSIRTAIDR